VCRCVSSTDIFHYVFSGSWNNVFVLCVLLVCRYMIVSSPLFCSLCLGEVLCLVCGGCVSVKLHPIQQQDNMNVWANRFL
jgi:hypothetical protein